MGDRLPTVAYLSGAGGGTFNFDGFEIGGQEAIFKTIAYPDWRSFTSPGFTADTVIANLVRDIGECIPSGPIRIVGHSIGGHFGYAAALRLKALGHDVAGLCAIDSFMIATADASPGWQSRAVSEGLKVWRRQGVGGLMGFARSKTWRAVFRLAGGRLPNIIRGVGASARLMATSDPTFEGELNMRLLIRTTAPWLALLDQEPNPLSTPAVLIRTKFTIADDQAWRRRCPAVRIVEVAGDHHTLFEPENVGILRAALADATRSWR